MATCSMTEDGPTQGDNRELRGRGPELHPPGRSPERGVELQSKRRSGNVEVVCNDRVDRSVAALDHRGHIMSGRKTSPSVRPPRAGARAVKNVKGDW